MYHTGGILFYNTDFDFVEFCRYVLDVSMGQHMFFWYLSHNAKYEGHARIQKVLSEGVQI